MHCPFCYILHVRFFYILFGHNTSQLQIIDGWIESISLSRTIHTRTEEIVLHVFKHSVVSHDEGPEVRFQFFGRVAVLSRFILTVLPDERGQFRSLLALKVWLSCKSRCNLTGMYYDNDAGIRVFKGGRICSCTRMCSWRSQPYPSASRWAGWLRTFIDSVLKDYMPSILWIGMKHFCCFVAKCFCLALTYQLPNRVNATVKRDMAVSRTVAQKCIWSYSASVAEKKNAWTNTPLCQEQDQTLWLCAVRGTQVVLGGDSCPLSHHGTPPLSDTCLHTHTHSPMHTRNSFPPLSSLMGQIFLTHINHPHPTTLHSANPAGRRLDCLFQKQPFCCFPSSFPSWEQRRVCIGACVCGDTGCGRILYAGSACSADTWTGVLRISKVKRRSRGYGVLSTSQTPGTSVFSEFLQSKEGNFRLNAGLCISE